jgi:translation initiation factor IF-2
VDLAAGSGAVVTGFNTTAASGARAAAEREEVDIREYDIIYKLLDDSEGAMEGLLDPEEVESALGTAEVRAVFPVGRRAVAGCYVQSGKIVRNRLMRVRRNGNVVFDGVIDSLKRMKEDAREVNSGYECGIGSSKFADWQEGDIIEAYEMVMQRRTLAGK